jgi:hypothetical protein
MQGEPDQRSDMRTFVRILCGESNVVADRVLELVNLIDGETRIQGVGRTFLSWLAAGLRD